MYKNVASQKIIISVKDATSGALLSGDTANITGLISKDGGTATATNDVHPAEIGTTGYYVFDLSQAETNADLILLIASTTTSGKTIDPVIIYTNNKEANLIQIDGNATSDNSATLKLKQLDIHNTSGHGINIVSEGDDAHGINIASSGVGLRIMSTDDGVYIYTSSLNKNGIYARGTGENGIGLKLEGNNSSGNDIFAGEISSIPLDVWKQLTANLTTAESIGKKLADIGTSNTGTRINAQIIGSNDIDLTATQKASVSTSVWNTLLTAITTSSSIGKKLKDWVLGTDNKSLISTDAQDLSATLSVNAKKLNTATPNNLSSADVLTALGTGGSIDNQLSEISSKTDQLEFTAGTVNANIATGGIGTGSSTVNYYVYTNESAKTGPIANCTVWVTSDSAGTTVVAQNETDVNGKAVFYLNAGTYYFWRSKTGYTFTNPDTEAVS